MLKGKVLLSPCHGQIIPHPLHTSFLCHTKNKSEEMAWFKKLTQKRNRTKKQLIILSWSTLSIWWSGSTEQHQPQAQWQCRHLLIQSECTSLALEAAECTSPFLFPFLGVTSKFSKWELCNSKHVTFWLCNPENDQEMWTVLSHCSDPLLETQQHYYY